jgi:hypothetical protein
MNNKISLKININDRFSIRVDAEVVEKVSKNGSLIWELKTQQDSLSSMISSGSLCEIGVPGQETLQGRIQQVQPMDRDWLSVKALVN